MRFRHRTKVDFPHPEGPISAVAWLAGASIVMSNKRLCLSVPGIEFFDFDPDAHIQLAPFNIPRPATKRTALTEATIRTIKISAPAHACLCQSS